MCSQRHHVDASWLELVSKIRTSCADLPEMIVDDGPDPRVAAAIWRLLIAPEHTAVVDRCDVYLERHGQQLESLCRQIVARGPFDRIVEFGAGKALLGRVLQEMMPDVRVTSIEINQGLPGFDGLGAERMVQDVTETEAVQLLLENLKDNAKGRVCVVAKHLCGSATDALLQALVLSSVDAVFVAPCCHSKIKHWEAYCNRDFLVQRSFASHEWPMLIKLLAVSRLPIDPRGRPAAEKGFSSWQRWEATFGGRAAMIGLGRKVRLMIENGRADLLRGVGLQAQVVEYAPATETSENVLIIASKATISPPATVRTLRVGVVLDVPSGALRTAQFLMELRGSMVARGGDLLWHSIIACSDDAVAVLGADAELVLSSLREHATLLATLRVVNSIYPFSSSVSSLQDLELPRESKGPFRLAVTPRKLLNDVLAIASTIGLELSPQHFNFSISVCRLWDGNLGVACLPRASWNPAEEPRSWEMLPRVPCAEGCGGYSYDHVAKLSMDLPAQLQGTETHVRRMVYRLEEWQLRLGVRVRGAGVVVCADHLDAWHAILVANGATIVESKFASMMIMDGNRSLIDGLALVAECPPPISIAIVPIAATKHGGGRASRASQMLDDVAKSISGLRLCAHHLLSNRDRERTIVLRRCESRKV